LYLLKYNASFEENSIGTKCAIEVVMKKKLTLGFE